MNNSSQQPENSADIKVNPRVIIAGLWISTFFIFAYVDIFSLMRADFLGQILAGQVAVFEVGQTFLFYTTLYVVIPSVMVSLSLLLPAKANRWANVIVGAVYILTIAAGCIGETWIYYLFGSAIEVILLSTLVWHAWKLPQ